MTRRGEWHEWDKGRGIRPLALCATQETFHEKDLDSLGFCRFVAHGWLYQPSAPICKANADPDADFGHLAA
jgi:hypothetical protein